VLQTDKLIALQTFHSHVRLTGYAAREEAFEEAAPLKTHFRALENSEAWTLFSNLSINRKEPLERDSGAFGLVL
jgi:hypothetical protein